MQDGIINNPPNPFVFRLQNINAMNEDWFESNEYTNNDINAIPDREPPTSDLFIASIPSPFAMMDMVRTSLQVINNQIVENEYEVLRGDTIYHKLISNMLDIGEIFFNYNSYINLIAIKKWNRYLEIDKLINSTRIKHRLLGDTFNLFFEQDAENFNFRILRDIYYLEFNNGVVNQNIIGGTSPITLFFPSPDAENLPNINQLYLTGRPIFSKIEINNQLYYQPLYERDYDYILYLYYLSTLNDRLIELRTYIEKNIQYLQQQNEQAFINKFNNFENDRNAFNNRLIDIQFQQDGNNYTVNIINDIPFKQSPTQNIQSDFMIKPKNINRNQRLPLVLSRKEFKGYSYVNNIEWDIDKINVPYKCMEEDIEKRILPNTQINYPYLTVNDFLEEYIIETELPINSDYFFDGNYYNPNDRNTGVLLPIKDRFFDYFDVEFLMRDLKTGEKVLEIRKLAGGNINVKLRIPIQKGFVTLERTYYCHNAIANISEITNEGGYKILSFGLAITPFINNNINPLEKFIIIADDERKLTNLNFNLNFYSGLTQIQVRDEIELIQKSQNDIGLKGYFVNEYFDRIKLNFGGKSFLVVPKFRIPNQNNSQYTFSVDFGASSTYISYRKDNDVINTYEIDSNEPITKTLHNVVRTSDIYELINMYFLPEQIKESNNVLYKFPTISALQTKNSDDITYTTFLDTNISFHYFRVRQLFQHLRYHTNLKWGNYVIDHNSEEYRNIRAFIRCILYMIKYKVLADGGNLDNVKINWFYPLSMLSHRYNDLANLWRECFQKIISQNDIDNKLKSTSESLTPFYYYLDKYRNRIYTQELKLLLDVGASTTDLLCFSDNRPIFASSFRFASRILFSDAIMNFVKEIIRHELERLGNNAVIKDLIRIFKDLNAHHRPSYEVAEFCFSLSSHNRLTEEQRLILDFGEILFNNQNGKARIIILFYYAAILYYCLKLTRLINQDGLVPQYIYFSGNGSKIFLYFNRETLERFSNCLLKKIYDTDDNINLIFDEEPKKLTSKGVYFIQDMNYFNFNYNENIKAIYLGDKENTIVNYNNSKVYNEIVNQEGVNINMDDNFKTSLIEEVMSFLDIFISMNREINYRRSFGIENFNHFRNFINNQDLDLEDILTGSLNTFFRDYVANELRNDLQERVNDPFFFYPLIGFLNTISFELLNN